MLSKQIKIKDVATLAQAPISAVSLILNNKPNTYSKETAKRVRKAAEILGYRPRAYAASMRSGRYNQIVLLMGLKGESTLQTPLRRSLHDELAKNKQRLGLADVDNTHFENPETLSSYFTQWASDGFILNYLREVPIRIQEHLVRFSIPSVTLNIKEPTDCIRPQDYEGSYLLTQKLIKKGHKRITYVEHARVSAWQHFSEIDRLQGYLNAMTEAGLEPEITQGPNNDNEGADLLSELKANINPLLERKKPATALLCYSAMHALQASIITLMKGMSPDDLEILGFGDADTHNMGLPFTPVIVPFKGVGEVAIQELLKKVEDPSYQFETRTIAFDLDRIAE